MHILAISGVHLTIAGALLFSLIHWLLRRSTWLILHCNVKKVSGLLCAPLLIGYTLLAGGNAPVARACIMSLLLVLALCTDRRKTFSALIGFGAVFILTLSPQALFTVSFQLSFCAFTSIMLLLPLLQKLLMPFRSDNSLVFRSIMLRFGIWLVCSLLVSAAAALGTAPIVIYHFHRLPLAGPVANLMLEPLICLLALPLAFLALPCMPFAPHLAAVFLDAGGFAIRLAVWAAGLFEAIPQATLWPSRPGLPLVILYYGSFILLITSLYRLWSKVRVLAALLLFSLCLTVMFNPSLRLPQAKPDGTTVDILDVGQGSAVLITFDDGTHLLIDAGGSSYGTETVGERLIAPFLWNNGITRIETIVVTHPDSDHYNGLPFLLQHFSPKRIWTSTLSGGDQHYRQMLAMATAHGIEVVQAEKGMTLHQGRQSRVSCLANTAADTDHGNRNEGLVVQLVTGSCSLLFPGDIESDTERRLVLSGSLLASDILLAAHHGSATSNSALFLGRVKPKIVVASAGRSRATVFPSQTLKNYCSQHGLTLLVTAEAGTVRFIRQDDVTKIQVLKDWEGNPLHRQDTKWMTVQEIGTEE